MSASLSLCSALLCFAWLHEMRELSLEESGLAFACLSSSSSSLRPAPSLLRLLFSQMATALLVLAAVSLCLTVYYLTSPSPACQPKSCASLPPPLLPQRAAAAAAAGPAFDFQSWLLSLLRPLPPRPLPPAQPNVSVLQDGLRVFHHAGPNYAMGSRSSRLQRLPLCQDWWDARHRFPANPAVIPHPVFSSAAADGSFEFLLSVQLGSGHYTRLPGKKSRYSDAGFGWSVKHVAMRLTLRLSGRGAALQVEAHASQQQHFAACRIDMRLVSFSNLSIAYDNKHGAVLLRHELDAGQEAGGQQAGHWRMSSAARHEVRMAGDEGGKNFMAAAAEGELFYVQHFAPFTLIACGLPQAPLPGGCRLHAFHELSDSLLPASRTLWRGSTPLVPLPAFPELLLGCVHERSTSGRRAERDFYYNRFVLVDSSSWTPFAFSQQPFGLFAELTVTDWYEFVMGLALAGEDELLLTFGYNDQEPWMALIPLSGVLQSLQTVSKAPRHAARLSELVQHYTASRS